MRRVFLVAASVMLASCKLRTLASVVAFEGEVDMTMDTPIAPTSTLATTYAFKGTKVRTTTKGVAGIVMIADTEAKKAWMVDDAAHTYSEMDLAKLTKASTSKPKSTSKARKTGRSDKVAGYACDVWEVDDRTSHGEVCMTSGLSMLSLGLSGPFSAFADGDDAWSEVFAHGFPLRVVMSTLGGPPLMKVEATRIEKKSVPDAEFAIPAGYTKTPSPI